MPQHPAAV